jgi:hypothetical protein
MFRAHRTRFTAVVVAAMAIGLAGIGPAYAAEPAEPSTASRTAVEEAVPAGINPTALAQCRAGTFCTWQNAGFEGRFEAFTRRDPNLTRRGYDNKITSVWNRTGSSWGLYEHDKYCGYNRSYPPGFRGYVGADMNNLASSVKNVFLFCGQE